MKKLQKKDIIVGICFVIITGLLYFYTSIIHWLVGCDVAFLKGSMGIVILVFAILGCFKFYKYSKEPRRYLIYFLIVASLMVALCSPHMRLSIDKFHNDFIIAKDGSYYVYDKWSNEIVSISSDCDALFFAKNEENTILVEAIKGPSNEDGIYLKINTYRLNETLCIKDKSYSIMYTHNSNDEGIHTSVLLNTYIEENKKYKCFNDLIESKIGEPIMNNDNKDFLTKKVRILYALEVKDTPNDNLGDASKETTKLEQNSDDFTNIGKVEVWYYIVNNEGVQTDMKSDNLMLQVKSVNGDNFYYIFDGEERFLVKRYRYCMEGDWTNAKAGKYYFNNPIWPEEIDNSEPARDEQISKEPSEIHVKVDRDPQPVTVWVPCYGCNGSGQCQVCYGLGHTLSGNSCFICGSSGKCTQCAGQGGHNEVQYR